MSEYLSNELKRDFIYLSELDKKKEISIPTKGFQDFLSDMESILRCCNSVLRNAANELDEKGDILSDDIYNVVNSINHAIKLIPYSAAEFLDIVHDAVYKGVESANEIPPTNQLGPKYDD